MNGRSIQDIVPPARSKPIRPLQSPPPQEPHDYHQPMNSEPRSSLPFVWIAVGALVVAGVIVGLMSTVFHTAHVRVTLMEWRSDISGSYMAGGENALPYVPVKVQSQATRSVPATGLVDAADRASGTITVSNLYSAKPQRLITNTRFETTDGKVYRIHAPLTVPGYTTRNGQKVAGTIEAVVHADQPGETYNKVEATFKLPGLKGSTQYDLITATAQGALSGGFVGKKATVEKSVRDQAVAEMKAELDRILREKVLTAQPPASLILLDSITIRYVEQPDIGADGNATLTIDGTALAPSFPSDVFARELGGRANITSDAPLALQNSNEIQFAHVETTQLAAGGPISFTLSGTGHVRVVFNERAFAEDLAGMSISEVSGVKATYPALSGLPQIAVRPFWLSTLPRNPERISVTVMGALDQ